MARGRAKEEAMRYTSALSSALPEKDAQAAAGLIFFFVRLNEKVAAYAEDLTRIQRARGRRAGAGIVPFVRKSGTFVRKNRAC